MCARARFIGLGLVTGFVATSTAGINLVGGTDVVDTGVEDSSAVDTGTACACVTTGAVFLVGTAVACITTDAVFFTGTSDAESTASLSKYPLLPLARRTL